ncbi:hypothetical protein AFA91_20325 [Mycolicibacterium goodii]|uniref:Cupin type-2 domain-containing protein n=2 Tax=Mycolicibacterium goodii TaxID=134601 RepID=A0A0K0X908_MYCGD|nr:hypothetical protein AFA91_20325 [Mycolicibacterium goodii]
MHVWSTDMESVPEHLGTATTKYMIPKEAQEQETTGTYMALAGVFQVQAGQKLKAHHHPTHEYWFVIEGRGVMQVADEARVIEVGDLIYTPPNTPHQVIADASGNFRAFVYALGYPGQGSQHIDVELPAVPLPE